MSGVYAVGYDGSNAIDGRMESYCTSNLGDGSWLSVRVPDGARVGFVAVHNARHQWNYMLYSQWASKLLALPLSLSPSHLYPQLSRSR